VADSKIFDKPRTIYIIFFISGICGLAYEILWVRMLGLILGNSIYAVSLVVAAFMAGLGLGSYLAGRYIEKHPDPLRIYALLEIGIGIFALLSPLILSLLSPIYAWFGKFWISSPILLNILRFKLAFIVLLIPTILMGGTLPILSRYFIRKQNRLGGDIARLYGVNTLGAVIGCLLTGFVLIEFIGVRQTIFAMAAINLAIGLIVWIFGKGKALPEFAETETRKSKEKTSVDYPQSLLTLILIVFALSGFASIAYEVIWTRSLAFFIGHTSYAFTSILASFLLGIGLGSLIVSRYSDKAKNLILALGIAEILIGLTAVVGIPLLSGTFYAMERSFGLRTWATPIWIKFVYSFCIMLLPTLLMGITFPLAAKIYLNIKDLGKGIGRIYAINTLGGIFGSFAAVFILIPLLGLQSSIIAVAIINLLIGVILIFRAPDIGAGPKSMFISGAILAMAILGIILPSNTNIYSLTNRDYRGQSLYYKEGLNNTIEIFQRQDKILDLFIDGELNASTSKTGMLVHKLLTQLPIMLHPNPRSVFQVGLGSGMTSGAALPFKTIETINCAEISKDIVDAASKFSEWNHNIIQSPRFNLQLEDGRIALLTDKRKYDIMVTGIIHPKYNPGNAGLYSKDYYELCKSRLSEDGIMCQWIPLNALRDSEFKMIIATFQQVFPHTSLWFEELFGANGNNNAILIGTNQQLRCNYDRIAALFQNPSIAEEFRSEGIENPAALLNRFIACDGDLAEYSGSQPEISDNRPRLEFGTVEIKDFSSILSDLAKLKSPILPFLENRNDSIDSQIVRFNKATRLCIAADAARWRNQASEVMAGYTEAAKLMPEDKAIQTELARFAQAKSDYNGTTQNDSDSQIANLIRQNKFEQAIPLLEKILVSEPNNSEYLRAIGLAYLRTGKVDLAIERLQKAVALNRLDNNARNNLGIAFMQKGMFDKAADEFSEILKNDPEYTQAIVNLGFSYARTGRKAEAIPLLEKAQKLEPNNEMISKVLDQLRKNI
jgi:spermidine synthase